MWTLTFKLFLQIYIGANEDSPLIQNCEDVYKTCGIKKWKQPMRPLEIIVHYKYGFYRDDVEKDQKVTKIRDGIAQNVLMVMCLNVLLFVDLWLQSSIFRLWYCSDQDWLSNNGWKNW